MGLFGLKKDYFLDKYGEIDLFKPENSEALVDVATLEVYSDKFQYGHRALFILKSYLGMDMREYENCKRGFEKHNNDFWEEWLKCMHFDENIGQDPVFLFWIKNEYDKHKKHNFYTSEINFNNGDIYETQLMKIYNNCASISNKNLTKEFASDSVIFSVAVLNSLPDNFSGMIDLEVEMIAAGLDFEQRNELFFNDSVLQNYEVVLDKYESFKNDHSIK